MPVRIVQSKQNARLKELRRALTKPGHEGLVAIEGPILITEAVRAGLWIECIFAAQNAQTLLATLPVRPDADVLLFPRTVLEAALTTEAPQPVAALVEEPRWTWEQAFTARAGLKPLLLVLAGLQDPGNLGTIVRSAEAFGASGIVSLTSTVNEWNPKALRASAGSIFRVPVMHAAPEEALKHLRKAGVRILTTTVHRAESADAVDLTRPVALMIGNEGNGVPPALAAQADAAITIPCPGPVESLNAAVATSVLLYEAARQRAQTAGTHPTKRSTR